MSPRTRCQPGPEAVLGAALADGLLFVAGGEMMTGFLSRLSRNRKQKAHICSAVVVAAGTASRMEGIDKILTTLGDLPVLVHTLRVFEDCPDIAEVVVVTREDLLVEVSRLCREFDLEKVSKVVVGGKERIYSVQAGLAEVVQMVLHRGGGADPHVLADLPHGGGVSHLAGKGADEVIDPLLFWGEVGHGGTLPIPISCS